MKRNPGGEQRRSIFRALFIPLFVIMILQALVFYFAAVYGGVQESLMQNAAGVFTQRLDSRRNEIEARFNDRWAALDDCVAALDGQYAAYQAEYGAQPFSGQAQTQIQFLRGSVDILIDSLRYNQVNGIFLILNDKGQAYPIPAEGEQKYGLCIRDMDQGSNYSGREDLLVERAPSSLVDDLGCSLDSWWEALYTFADQESGDYYYQPLAAAWDNPGAKGEDVAYCSSVHRLSGSDPAMISYSIPLLGADGTPYGVLGVELSTRYLATLLPNAEIHDSDRCCYVLAMRDSDTTDCQPIVGSGSLYNRCFGENTAISCGAVNDIGGFDLSVRNVELFGALAPLDIYNNNNPFEGRQLVLLALVERDSLFAYVAQVRTTLLLMALLSLAMGLLGLVWVSRRFAAPITALAQQVRGLGPSASFQLGRLGIREIDQLVDSIEELNRNVSRTSARTEFFSRMSHDMRTPMNAILSFSSPELLDGASEAVKDDYLAKIHDSGAYLLSLINEVLDMTKIDSNKIELVQESTTAASLFQSTIPIIEKLAQAKQVEFVTRLQIPAGLSVLADRQHINQIVMNLLGNAVKFTPSGGVVTLGVELRPADVGPDRWLCLVRVEDTGIGMSKEFMRSMYMPFEQASGKGEGTGLGLSIAQKLTQLMGGSIDCESQLGLGTTFTVQLPLEQAEQPSEGAEAVAGRLDLSSLDGKRVLVCEDNHINTLIICNLLQRVGLKVETAENGSLGVAAFEASAPGTYAGILMDIRMPVMDGLTAAKTIRASTHGDAATIPILAMTANAFNEDVEASRKAGINAHLVKPIEPPKLYAALLEFL